MGRIVVFTTCLRILEDHRASEAKELDRKARQRGTERVLKSCRDSGMKGIEEREKAWREERRLWHEETWTALHYKFECWMKIMDGLQPRKRLTEEG